MAIKPKRISGVLRNRKMSTNEDTSAIIEENIQLNMFPHPISREFLIGITDYMKYMKRMNRCVVYYSNPENSELMSGYYEVVRFDSDRVVIFTSKFGEYSVPMTNCFLTQELLHAYKKGIRLKFKSAKLSEDSDVIKELREEAWGQLLISSADLL